MREKTKTKCNNEKKIVIQSTENLVSGQGAHQGDET